MPTSKQESDFVDHIANANALSESIEWIQDNLEPDDVFTDKQLESWAENNSDLANRIVELENTISSLQADMNRM